MLFFFCRVFKLLVRQTLRPYIDQQTIEKAKYILTKYKKSTENLTLLRNLKKRITIRDLTNFSPVSEIVAQFFIKIYLRTAIDSVFLGKD